MTIAVAAHQAAMSTAAETRAGDGAVTIVIPTYNHAHFIADALDSVFAQTLLPARVLILDDASTDNTAEVLRPYLRRIPHVDYLQMPHNRGVVEMLNVSLEQLDTEYAVFLAADDMIDRTALEKSAAIMNCNPRAPVCGVLARYIDEAKRPLPTPALFEFGSGARYLAPNECLRWLMRRGALFSGNGAMYRVAPLRAHGGFAHQLRSFCDGFRIQDLALSDGVCIVPEVLASWRQSAKTYAAVHRTDPVGALAIAEAVDAELQRENSPFPPGYATRLMRRLRFTAGQAAVTVVPTNVTALRSALANYPAVITSIVALCARVAGVHVASAALAVLLRPFDIARAVGSRRSVIP